MYSTTTNSSLFQDLFSTEQMRNIFSDESLIKTYISIEIALARAEGALGVIPAFAAEIIERQCNYESLDLERLRNETTLVGYPILPLVRQMSEMCGEPGEYIHWGATTQDIMDTAVTLQIRLAMDLVEASLSNIRAKLAEMAGRYRDTPMAGRTHLQQALPITFGYKAAIWLSMLDRHHQRLLEIRPRTNIVQFGGAAGTLASLGDRGLEVQQALAAELQLHSPVATWHVARDNFAEVVNFLGLVTGSLGKIALDLMIMASTEFDEVHEAHVDGRGASSTMPQKRNPISCEIILAASKSVRHYASLMLEATVQDFERATGPWQAEWLAIPQAFLLASGALAQAEELLAGLIIDELNMGRNLNLSQGLIVAEGVMMAIAPIVGRQRAHDLVYMACSKSREEGIGLAVALASFPAISQCLNKESIEDLLSPSRYVGLAPTMVDHVIEASTRIGFGLNCPDGVIGPLS